MPKLFQNGNQKWFRTNSENRAPVQTRAHLSLSRRGLKTFMLRVRLEEFLRSRLWEALVSSGAVFGDWHYSRGGGEARNVFLEGSRGRTIGGGRATNISHS